MQIARDLTKISRKDANDYLGSDNVGTASLEIGNILRHSSPQNALSVYDHALARLHEVKSNRSLQTPTASVEARM